ncbi:hypothetical protein FISHEDRAFT_77011 [Fistulina hepatica ATCC 64428]|uniref:Uncharacterized protein n=1 Tax=Fistulina hepatica ATCC 64428 TaxID=1128425 RepID=A0A0D7A2N2_9AGAR|nr:hypothetical protein FISHEDRAFT_77011 [Fistulina hepatica ATCC 64428]
MSVLRLTPEVPPSAHGQCSESFYKKEIETEIRTTKTKSSEERTRMLELLRQFEQDAEMAEGSGSTTDDAIDDPDFLRRFVGTDGSEGEEGEDHDVADISQRFQGVNLDSVPAEALWERLTPAEQARFLRTVHDPKSELLSDAQLYDGRIGPWWKAPLDTDSASVNVNVAFPPQEREGNAALSEFNQLYLSPPPKYGLPPVAFPANGLPPIPSTSKATVNDDESEGDDRPLLLLYNIAAVCIAYAYTTRHFGVSPLVSSKEAGREDADRHPDTASMKKCLARLVPFLTERSSFVHRSLESVVTDLLSRFDENVISHSAFALLLRDAAMLFRPPNVIALSEFAAQPGATDNILLQTPLALALADIVRLFAPQTPKKHSLAYHKLRFYLAHVCAVPSLLLRAVATELESRTAEFMQQNENEDFALSGTSRKLKDEGAVRPDVIASSQKEDPMGNPSHSDVVSQPRIVEMD